MRVQEPVFSMFSSVCHVPPGVSVALDFDS